MPQSENLGDSRRIRPITCSCLIPDLFTVMSHYIPTPLWNNDEQFRLAGVDSFTPTKSSFTKRVTGVHLGTVGNLPGPQIAQDTTPHELLYTRPVICSDTAEPEKPN